MFFWVKGLSQSSWECSGASGFTHRSCDPVLSSMSTHKAWALWGIDYTEHTVQEAHVAYHSSCQMKDLAQNIISKMQIIVGFYLNQPYRVLFKQLEWNMLFRVWTTSFCWVLGHLVYNFLAYGVSCFAYGYLSFKDSKPSAIPGLLPWHLVWLSRPGTGVAWEAALLEMHSAPCRPFRAELSNMCVLRWQHGTWWHTPEKDEASSVYSKHYWTFFSL